MFRKVETSSAPAVIIIVDGVAVEASAGDSVAAVLLHLPPPAVAAGWQPGDGRGPFCLIGTCFECRMEIDGIPDVRACLVRVRAGLTVRRSGASQTEEPSRIGHAEAAS